MTRLPILESTVKQLYGTATVCAFPGCAEPLLRWVAGLDAPVLNSRIAHIAAASPKGPRYDAAMSDVERRAFDNLVLLCLPHAEEVDLAALVDRYRPETLKAWKAVQLQSAPVDPPLIPEGLLERAVVLSMGDVLMDFREATIDLGGKAAQAPGAGRGWSDRTRRASGDGGKGGDHYEFSVTGTEVLGEVPIEIGRGGRPGVGGMPGEAGGHTRVGHIVTPGGGRESHALIPEPLRRAVSTSISSAVLGRYAEVANGLVYLSGAGWTNYNVETLPGPFGAALCVWVDLSWSDVEPASELTVEAIAELVTPIKTATFSEKQEQRIALAEPAGFVRLLFVFSVVGTLYDEGLHTLNVTTNTGAQLGQYLQVGRIRPSTSEAEPARADAEPQADD